jgi:hypothetical protein
MPVATDGEGEVHLEGADGGVDLVGNGRVSGVGHAEFFDLGEDAVTLVDVAGVELEVLLVGFIGNLAGFPLHFGEKGFLLIRITMSHNYKVSVRCSSASTPGTGLRPSPIFIHRGVKKGDRRPEARQFAATR